MKPQSTWQVYNQDENILTVHVGDENSEIYYQGPAENYDGTATEPAAPTSQYLEKHAPVEENVDESASDVPMTDSFDNSAN